MAPHSMASSSEKTFTKASQHGRLTFWDYIEIIPPQHDKGDPLYYSASQVGISPFWLHDPVWCAQVEL